MTTRKGFLAASGATLTALASPSVAHGQSTRLDEDFVRREAPSISLRYPQGWNLAMQAVTDLVDPIQLFTLSTRRLPDEGSRGGHFDLALFQRDAAVLACVASEVVPGETDLSNAHPLDAGVRFADFDGGTTDDSGTGFTTYGQWYAANGYVYMLFLWVGPAAKDWDAMPAVVDTIRFSA